MPRSVYDRGLMTPREVETLQRVFDDACHRSAVRPDTEDAREIALTLLALYNAGMRDEAMLASAAGSHRPHARCA